MTATYGIAEWYGHDFAVLDVAASNPGDDWSHWYLDRARFALLNMGFDIDMATEQAEMDEARA